MLRLFLCALGLGLTLLAALYVGIAGWSAWQTLQVIRSWPSVDAQVVESRVFSARRRGFLPAFLEARTYGGECRMRYTVGDSIYTSRVEIGYRSSSLATMRAWVDRLPAGGRLRIRYDPAAPERISLADRPNTLAFAASLATLPWAAGAALGSAACWLGARRLRARPDPG